MKVRAKHEAIISTKGMHVTYFPGKSNEVRALKNISLTINAGEFIIFFGPSGCGKSTLLYAISGLERKVQGDIFVHGKNIAAIEESDMELFHQNEIGMIFQSFYLIASLTILQNVALPQTIMGERKRDREKKAQQLLDQFGVGRQANKLPNELSGGQQQRVAICRSLMNDPPVIMADEPVGNLDSKSSEDVMNLLRDLNTKQKKTIILVTHDPSHLHHAHRIFYLSDGQITSVKENTEEERKRSIVSNTAEKYFSTGLQHWMRTLGSEKLREDVGIQAVLRTHEVLTELFTGLTVDEMATLEQHVQRCIADGKGARDTLEALLRKHIEDGGFGMNVRHREKLLSNIDREIVEIQRLQHMEKMKSGKKARVRTEAREIRQHTLEYLDLDMHPSTQRDAVDAALAARIEDKTTFRGLLRGLDLPPPEGAGLDRRNARKIARHAEALILAGIGKQRSFSEANSIQDLAGEKEKMPANKKTRTPATTRKKTVKKTSSSSSKHR